MTTTTVTKRWTEKMNINKTESLHCHRMMQMQQNGGYKNISAYTTMRMRYVPMARECLQCHGASGCASLPEGQAVRQTHREREREKEKEKKRETR